MNIQYKIIKLIISILLIGSLGFFLINTEGTENKPLKKPIVAISQVVEHEALNETYKGIMDELEAQDYVKGKNIDILFETAQGSPLLAGQIAQKFAGMKPSVMVGIGTTAAQSLVSANRGKNIPIVFSSVTDPVGAQLVASLTNPGSGVTGVSNWIPLPPQLTKYKEILPNLKRLGIIFNPGEGNSVILVNRLKDLGPQMGIDVIEAPATISVEVGSAAEHISNKVDAIFISNDNTALSAFEAIVNVANRSKIPVFVSDTDMVKRGAVAALGPDQYQLGRQTGKMIIEILKGNSPSNMPVAFPEKTEFYINLHALEAVHLNVPADLINSADKIINNIETKPKP